MVRTDGKMDEGRLFKNVMNTEVNGKKIKGTPMYGLMYGVNSALNDRVSVWRK